MHAGARRPGGTGPHPGRAGSGLALAAVCLLAACAVPDRQPSSIELRWTLTPAPPDVTVGTLRLDLELVEAGSPVTRADLRIHGLMTHPGMVPVLAEATETAPGRYAAQLDLTMAGDWVLLVEGTLADGRPLRGERPLPGVSPP